MDRKRWAAWMVVIILYGTLQVGPAVTAVYSTKSGRDFATYHYAVHVAASGGNPYDVQALGAAARAEGTRRSVHPYFYPPPFLLGMVWCLPLSMVTAYRLFFWVNQLFLLLSLWVFRRWTKASWLGMGVVAATLTPLGDATKMGQANHMVLLFVLLALCRSSGGWLSLAGMSKMSPAIFVSLWGVRLWWRPVLWAAAGAVLLSVAALPLVDFSTQMMFYRDILPGFSSGEYHGLTVPITLPANHSIPDLYNQVWPGPDRHHLSDPAQRASSLTALALLGGLLWLGRRRRDVIGEAALAGVFTILMVITPVYTYEHHLALLFVPSAALMAAWERGRLTRKMSVVALISYFFVAWPLYMLRAVQSWSPDAVDWMLQESKFFGVLGLALCCLSVRRTPSESGS